MYTSINPAQCIKLNILKGASQFPNWEAWPLRNESCYIGSSSRIPCRQGRVSLYSAAVESTEHIQTAINFASQHNLRLAVKNTGHDFVGRSLAPLSLQIFTHKMKEMSFARKFRPKGFNASEEELGPAVTVSAGVQLHDMYLFCHKNNVSVVAGHANSVGVAGGYIQGGGHSILGPWKGMAVDNVLQYTLVLANVSDCAYHLCLIFLPPAPHLHEVVKKKKGDKVLIT